MAKKTTLQRVPAMKVDEEVKLAVLAAARNLRRFNEIINSEIPQVLSSETRSGRDWTNGIPHVKQEKIPQAESEVRSFFWNLCQIFDLLLVSANETLALGLSINKVDWDNVKGAVRGQNKESAQLWQKLKALKSEHWFQELKELRDFAHRGQHMLNADIGERGVNATKLVPAMINSTDVASDLSEYLVKMQKFLGSLVLAP